MHDKCRATERCARNFCSVSTVLLPNRPGLYGKNSLQQNSLLTSAQGDWVSSAQACRGTSGVRLSNDETSQVGVGLGRDEADRMEGCVGYIDEDGGCHGPTSGAYVDDSPYEIVSKRKRLCKELEEDDEVESKFRKRQRSEEMDVVHRLSSPTSSIVGTLSAATPRSCDERKNGDAFFLDQSADELQMLCDDFGFEVTEQHYDSYSPEGGGDSFSSGSAKLSRRLKIKETVKLLREAIPGVDFVDTTTVLDEAINYVKLLQLQVQSLGAQRLAQRAGR